MPVADASLVPEIRLVVARRIPEELDAFDGVAQQIGAVTTATFDRGGSGGEFGFALADAVIPSLQLLAAAFSVSKAWIEYRNTKAKATETTLRSKLSRALKKRGMTDDAVTALVNECVAVLSA